MGVAPEVANLSAYINVSLCKQHSINIASFYKQCAVSVFHRCATGDAKIINKYLVLPHVANNNENLSE